ncbi:MAG: MarR family transcriptional regulator [Chakrabartia sp.]
MCQSSQDETQAAIQRALEALVALSQRISAPAAEALLHPVDAELRLRRRRERSFNLDYFGDAAWDILLELERGQRLGHRLAITDIGVESRIPLTTVLRYLIRLEKDELISRRVDPNDRRRVFVSLTRRGYEMVCDAFGIEPTPLPAEVEHRIGFAATPRSALLR